MRKFTLTALFLAFSALVITGCKSEPEEIILAHSQLESHPEHKAALAFKEAVEKSLGDKYQIKIYPDAQLGTNESVLKELKKGNVQYLIISTPNLERLDKLYSLFSIPYLFSSERAYENFILRPDIPARLSVNANHVGFRSVVAFTAGTRNFYSTAPIYDVDDLKGKKFRVQSGPMNVTMMHAFGAEATPMSFGKTREAIEQGVVDGAENNEIVLVDQKHGDIARFYSYTRHQMCPDMLVVSNSFINSLSAEERRIFDEAALKAQKVEFDAWHKAVEDARTKARDIGVKFLDIKVDTFRKKIMPLHDVLLAETPSIKPMYDEAVAANEAALKYDAVSAAKADEAAAMKNDGEKGDAAAPEAAGAAAAGAAAGGTTDTREAQTARGKEAGKDKAADSAKAKDAPAASNDAKEAAPAKTDSKESAPAKADGKDGAAPAAAAADAKTENTADSKDKNGATSAAQAAGVDAITPGSAGTTAGSNAFTMPADGLPAAAIAAGAAGAAAAAVAAGALKKDARQADQKATASSQKAVATRKAASSKKAAPSKNAAATRKAAAQKSSARSSTSKAAARQKSTASKKSTARSSNRKAAVKSKTPVRKKTTANKSTRSTKSVKK
ncbi:MULTISPECIES: TRAP transporter substrate-binding protein DctP [unclassified Anaerobiospirillum]|uniref:TRAP transporter substrate-binding protein DctP n=1 Tax=unclassified Anaerobiospirillum TaxID=2647410 RepID=UPI001FF17B0A|nr:MULTISPECIES: TRAP transporter substrate-binding protein DctP [unclassified Anaerobiospirillum]MCK0534059.1 TRAP transporter substrate-binding protein DctP [Anaerobiospirillum sp. NML120511]MCK0539198.1 TRAP transporter substrate-binding protein DctP [Anaerobiospirillum sp. NML02-A-032]